MNRARHEILFALLVLLMRERRSSRKREMRAALVKPEPRPIYTREHVATIETFL